MELIEGCPQVFQSGTSSGLHAEPSACSENKYRVVTIRYEATQLLLPTSLGALRVGQPPPTNTEQPKEE
jgi:hypothetical protein